MESQQGHNNVQPAVPAEPEEEVGPKQAREEKQKGRSDATWWRRGMGANNGEEISTPKPQRKKRQEKENWNPPNQIQPESNKSFEIPPNLLNFRINDLFPTENAQYFEWKDKIFTKEEVYKNVFCVKMNQQSHRPFPHLRESSELYAVNEQNSSSSAPTEMKLMSTNKSSSMNFQSLSQDPIHEPNNSKNNQVKDQPKKEAKNPTPESSNGPSQLSPKKPTAQQTSKLSPNSKPFAPKHSPEPPQHRHPYHQASPNSQGYHMSSHPSQPARDHFELEKAREYDSRQRSGPEHYGRYPDDRRVGHPDDRRQGGNNHPEYYRERMRGHTEAEYAYREHPYHGGRRMDMESYYAARRDRHAYDPYTAQTADDPRDPRRERDPRAKDYSKREVEAHKELVEKRRHERLQWQKRLAVEEEYEARRGGRSRYSRGRHPPTAQEAEYARHQHYAYDERMRRRHAAAREEAAARGMTEREFEAYLARAARERERESRYPEEYGHPAIDPNDPRAVHEKRRKMEIRKQKYAEEMQRRRWMEQNPQYQPHPAPVRSKNALPSAQLQEKSAEAEMERHMQMRGGYRSRERGAYESGYGARDHRDEEYYRAQYAERMARERGGRREEHAAYPADYRYGYHPEWKVSFIESRSTKCFVIVINLGVTRPVVVINLGT